MVHGRHEEIIHRVKHMNPGMIANAAEFEKNRQMELLKEQTEVQRLQKQIKEKVNKRD